tara:strand:- start:1278 stop:1688 length:411 start_codon:yes stop_codon:yes gene_type:complete
MAIILLRPHHLKAYIAYIKDPRVFFWSDKKYIRTWRNEWGKGDYHSDTLILHWRDIMKRMYDNPKLKFIYVLGLDTVCNKCEHADGREAVDCADDALELDRQAMAGLQALGIHLEFGKTYTSGYITNIFREKLGLK